MAIPRGGGPDTELTIDTVGRNGRRVYVLGRNHWYRDRGGGWDSDFHMDEDSPEFDTHAEAAAELAKRRTVH